MAQQPPGPALSHEELAALDFIIMRAIQRGAKPNEVLGFIDSIANAFTDAHLWNDAVPVQILQYVENIPTVVGPIPTAVAAAQMADLVGAVAQYIKGPAADAMKHVMSAMAKAPSLTLQQLIDLRRSAAQAQSGK